MNTDYNLDPRQQREADFIRVADDQFSQPIDRSLLANPGAFDRVASWDGMYPGIFAWGASGSGKTRSCWQSLRTLYVDKNRPFRWWTGRRLSDDYYSDFRDGEPDAFWRRLRYHRAFFVDDLDKFDLAQDRSAGFLFELADKIYRERIPFLFTSNHNREWWAKQLGEPFVRRMCDEATRSVRF
jgi:hypothetical protein